MPKATFLNLPEEKRDRLIFLSFNEFAMNTYGTASITQIAKEMRIAKGSIYQYFTNKRDLYDYLIERASHQKLDATAEFYKKSKEPFHKWLRKFCIASLWWDIQNPIMSCFLANVSKERSDEELGNVNLQHKKRSVEFFEKKIIKLIDKKELNPNIGAHQTAIFLSEFVNSLIDHLCVHYEIDLQQHAKTNTAVKKIGQKDIKIYLKDFNPIINRLLQPM